MRFTYESLLWLENILEERYGHRFSLLQEGTGSIILRKPGHKGCITFDILDPVFDESRSDFPCFEWNSTAEGWQSVLQEQLIAPGTIELVNPLIETSDTGFLVHYDILGLTYWMLTRLEEVNRSDLDHHGRFPAISSHAFKNGYLERPIVDEWLNILGQVITRLWPKLSLKHHEYSIRVSHDVDEPSRYGFQSFKGLLRTIASDIIKRGDFLSILKGPRIWMNSKTKIHDNDPANTFNWLMELSETNGLTSAFYFICGRTNPRLDADYELEHPAIRDLLRKIAQRGHEIGLHPSYNSCRDSNVVVREAARLKSVCAEEGIHQKKWGGRMHFLRWEQPETLIAWATAGMDYDSTLGYADRPGYRCGTCFEYPAFEPVGGRELPLRVRPLIAMECTIIANKYLGLGSGKEAYEKFHSLQLKCQAVGGQFTLLWHNSFFLSKQNRDLYQKIIQTT